VGFGVKELNPTDSFEKKTKIKGGPLISVIQKRGSKRRRGIGANEFQTVVLPWGPSSVADKLPYEGKDL